MVFNVKYYNPFLNKDENVKIEAKDKMGARIKFVSLWNLPLEIIEIS